MYLLVITTLPPNWLEILDLGSHQSLMKTNLKEERGRSHSNEFASTQQETKPDPRIIMSGKVNIRKPSLFEKVASRPLQEIPHCVKATYFVGL